MTHPLRLAALAVAVGMLGLLPASAQPKRGGGGDASVKQLEEQLEKLRDQVKDVEKKLESAKQREKAGRLLGRLRERGEKGKGGPFGGGFGKGMFGKGPFGKEKSKGESSSVERRLERIEKDLAELRNELRQQRRR